MIALSVRQPWAELIVSGRKTVEVRSRPTRLRGRVYVYASEKRADEHLLRGVAGLEVESLPTGVLVGSVEIAGCRPLGRSDASLAFVSLPAGTWWAWELEGAERARRLLRPKRQPQPVFFRPF